jgi:excisionase family DNA binding protein
MDATHRAWLSTEEAAREVGMTSEWVRKQIGAGRLVAYVWATGERRTYRIRRADWSSFLTAYSGRADDPRLRDEG